MIKKINMKPVSVHMRKIHSPEVLRSNFDQWKKGTYIRSLPQAQVSKIQGQSHCSFFILVKVHSIKSKWVFTEIDAPLPSANAPLCWLHSWRLLPMKWYINYLPGEQIPMTSSKQCVFLKSKASLKHNEPRFPNQLNDLQSMETEMRMGLRAT